MALDARVAAVRSFNRFFTERIGVLGEGLLHTDYSLTEARVLFELGQVEAMDVADLRAALGLDAGYLSRLLSRLDDKGLLRRERSKRDARRQRVALTPADAPPTRSSTPARRPRTPSSSTACPRTPSGA